MPSVRVQRVRELLKRQLGEILRQELPAGVSPVASVNAVDLSADLKSATVHVGVIASPDEQAKTIERLNLDHARLQGMIARAVILRHTPRLRFCLDTSVERGNRVLSILEELERSDPPPTST